MAEETISWTKGDLAALERKERLKLVNCFPGFKSANLVGVSSPAGVPNLAIFSSCIHLGSDPALLGLIFRPQTAASHSLKYIRAAGVYSINVVSRAIYRSAHRTSLKFPEGVSEFSEVGLTEQQLVGHTAPVVAESPLSLGMSVVEEIPIQANGTTLLIGAVECAELRDAGALNTDGGLNLEQMDVVAIGGVDQYYAGSFLEQMPHEKL